jgi:hypothetical protein
MDSGWSAIWNTSNPWVDPVNFPHFPKIGRLTAPVGYICWDFLFYVVVGLSGWAIWQDPFDDFTNLTRPSVESGHWLSPISMVGQRQGWSGDICDAVEAALLHRKGRREQENEEAALLSKSRLWRVLREGSVISVFANGGLF